MKKLILSLALLALPAFANSPVAAPLLQRISVALDTSAPRPWSWVRLNEGGMLEVKICRVAILPTYPEKKALTCETRKPAVIDGKILERIQMLMADATKGEMKFAPKAGEPVCAAIPVENTTYRSSSDQRVLWTGSVPCGGSYYNDSASAAELKQLLDGFLANE